ncbi:hypothetical protein J6590_051678 [Homalodisca vitripennis]|nr:hypothetical protein J6590_051678 [Homalodisca vitripennis]
MTVGVWWGSFPNYQKFLLASTRSREERVDTAGAPALWHDDLEEAKSSSTECLVRSREERVDTAGAPALWHDDLEEVKASLLEDTAYLIATGST